MNNRWIKCGLPWTFYDWNYQPEPPNLKKEEKKKFGKTTEQAYKELEAMLGGARFATFEYDRVVKTKEYKSGKRAYKKFCAAVQDWVKDHPSWIEYQQKLKDFDEEVKRKSFCGRELNKPGTRIEILVGKELKQYLIGDINTLGGVCDDCMGFGKDVIVVRYKNAEQKS